jgi:hypothetical protein
VALWQADYAEVVQSPPSVVFVHYGDTEAVELYLTFEGDDYDNATYRLHQMYMYRHSNGYFYWADELEFVGTHPVVYTSELKHGSYASREECEDSHFWGPLKEDCAEGEEFIADLAAEHNVGEASHPHFLTTDERPVLGDLFPGERIWDASYKFCGGYDVPLQSRNAKRGYVINLVVFKWEGLMPWCAGALRGKWLPKP